MGNVSEITYDDFDKLMAKPKDKFKLVSVTYYSQHCPSCITFHKVLDEVASEKEFDNYIQFTKVDCDQNPLLSSDVEYTPTTVLYGPDEKELVRLESSVPGGNLKRVFNEAVNKFYKREN